MASKIKVDQIEGAAGSTITIPTGQTLTITDGLAASTIGSGTLSDARLPTVPVSKGGTGLTSLGSAGQAIKVNSGGSALEFGTISSYADSDALSLLNASGSADVFAVRGWANITGGTAALRASGNCSSITDVGTGHYRFNFNNAMPNINYVVVGSSCENWNSSADSHNDHNNFALRRKQFTTSSFEIETHNQSYSNSDHEGVFTAAIG